VFFFSVFQTAEENKFGKAVQLWASEPDDGEGHAHAVCACLSDAELLSFAMFTCLQYIETDESRKPRFLDAFWEA